MTLTVTGTTITSGHSARTARLASGCQHIGQVSRLPGEVRDRNSALTAMILADPPAKPAWTSSTSSGRSPGTGPPNPA